MFVPKGMAKSIKERFGIFGFLDNTSLVFRKIQFLINSNELCKIFSFKSLIIFD